jgi:4-amino-4-deoxy-L-arabinose transferase-like glycosyltransferase
VPLLVDKSPPQLQCVRVLRAPNWRLATAVLARVGLVRVAIIVGITVVALSEGLGAIDAFARGPTIVAWLAVGLVAAAVLTRAIRRADDSRVALQPAPPRDPMVVYAVALIGIVIAICLIAALLSPPNGGDVLSYHLPRVRHWIQNRSFAHYPTHSLRQISFPPGAGYFVAHLQLLSGGDRFASLPQWGAFVGCILVTATLAGRLFGGRAVVTAALACATIPMAVMQSAQPQSDLLASFWLLCFVRLVFDRRTYRPRDTLWLGAALGLGWATKPTVLLFAIPFLFILAKRALRSGWRAGLAVPTAVVLLAAIPCLPHSVRNYRVFGNVQGPSLGITLARHDPRVLASNVLRHTALNVPSIRFWEGVDWVHTHVLHLDTNDPATTHPRVHARSGFEPRFANEYLIPDENMVANPLHVAIMVLGGGTALLVMRRRHGWATRRAQLAVALVLSFGLFCGAMRWQPWANRLLLPLVVLGSPLVGWMLAKASPIARATLIGLLGAIAIFFGLTSIRRPMIGHPQAPTLTILGRSRGDLYFADDEIQNGRGQLSRLYDTLLRQAKDDGCSRVALVSEEYDPEYLVWVTLDRSGKPVEMRNLGVANASRVAPAEIPDSSPCGLVEMMEHRWGRYTSNSISGRGPPRTPSETSTPPSR